jgi:hypothetical protein
VERSDATQKPRDNVKMAEDGADIQNDNSADKPHKYNRSNTTTGNHNNKPTSQWADKEGFYNVNMVLEGDFLLLCRFGGDFAHKRRPSMIPLKFCFGMYEAAPMRCHPTKWISRNDMRLISMTRIFYSHFCLRPNGNKCKMPQNGLGKCDARSHCNASELLLGALAFPWQCA